jgi:hypothetical protein
VLWEYWFYTGKTPYAYNVGPALAKHAHDLYLLYFSGVVITIPIDHSTSFEKKKIVV